MAPVGLRPVPLAEKAELAAMLAAYLAEHARIVGEEAGDPAAYPYLDAYWREPARRPFWIVAGEARLGLALVNDHSPSGLGCEAAVAEFYILPQARRGGAGLAAAQALFRGFPGQWELQVHQANAAAMAFWPRAIAAAGAREAEPIALGERIVHRFRMD